MIGNDVVDLRLAKNESNWRRKGFLDKIFTQNEQILIQNSKNHDMAVWNLWSRKEAVYKIWNRETETRKYNPIKFECLDLNLKIGKVLSESKVYYTKTEVLFDYIHSIAVTKISDFDKIITLNNSIIIDKVKGIPYCIDENLKTLTISKSHHGRYEKIISKN